MSKKLIQAAAGNAGESLYVEDVFSTYLYTGTSAAQTITNGIDLSGEGGLVWAKSRTGTRNHILSDTERGTGRVLFSNLTAAEDIDSTTITSYNSDGFSMGSSTLKMNTSGEDFVSWTFRKAEKFFDVVTYTGDGNFGRAIPHSLGSVPACVIVKRTSASASWYVYHSGVDAVSPENYTLLLDQTLARISSSAPWANTAPTATHFTVGDNSNYNESGSTYVAYLFASDAGGFGDDGSESIIKCGSYTGNGGSQEINLGFEPQWLMIKKSSSTGSWQIIDTMRGMPVDAGTTKYLLADSSGAEYGGGAEYQAQPTATGFKLGLSNDVNQSGVDFIYIAIRRPMKTPESGTEVFDVQQSTTTDPNFVTGFNPDMTFSVPSTTASFRYIFSRLTGTNFMETSSTNAESTGAAIKWDYSGGAHNGFTSYYGWNFRRATGFFDVVAYTGDGSNTTQNHNLGVEPEIIFFKKRSISGSGWTTYSRAIGATKYLKLDATDAEGTFNHFQDTDPTSTEFYLTSAQSVNQSAETFIAYLFATVAGVSKVGSYTGTGSNLDVDCGFSSGARFVLIKRADDTGGWYVWDSERGIVAGNDPYLLLNSTAAEVTTTDYIDPLSSGFTVTSSAPIALNLNGGTYIFLAIA